jgi:uncharacterized membrane protein
LMFGGGLVGWVVVAPAAYAWVGEESNSNGLD